MKKYLCFLAISLSTASVFAEGTPNYWSGHVSAGLGWSSVNNNDMVNVGGTTAKQYATSNNTSNQPIFGLGIAYNIPYPDVLLGIGLSAYYMHNTNVTGTNTPYADGQPFSGSSLAYSANGQSYALMLEPKFTWTRYALQPYVFVGAGLAINAFGNYAEWATDPNGTATPALYFPTSYDAYNLAYEMGAGVQYVIGKSPHAPTIGLDYRFMNWGSAQLAANSQ